MQFREFTESFNTNTLKWKHSLVDNGKPKKAYFIAGEYIYWIEFVGPFNENPQKLGNINGKNEYNYTVQFDVQRDSEGDPVKNTWWNKIKSTFDSAPDQSFLFRRVKTNQNEVISNVKKAVEEFITYVKPAILSWQGTDPELGQFYKKMITRFIPQGYKLLPNPFGGSRLVRDDIINNLLEKEKQPRQEKPGIFDRIKSAFLS